METQVQHPAIRPPIYKTESTAIIPKPISTQPSTSQPSILTPAPSFNDVPACRVCWSPEDLSTPGGHLISPCSCRGSCKHIHESCLYTWMCQVAQRKGLRRALQCDVCQRRYHNLPPGWHHSVKQPLHLTTYHSLQDTYNRILQNNNSPFKPILQTWSFLTWSAIGIAAAIGAGQEVYQAYATTMAARDDITALFPLLKKVGVLTVLESVFNHGRDMVLYGETMVWWGVARMIDSALSVAKDVIGCMTFGNSSSGSRNGGLSFSSSSPLSSSSSSSSSDKALFMKKTVIPAVFFIPQMAAIGVQYMSLAVMALFGGGAAGAVKGGWKGMTMPLVGVWWVVKAVVLKRGGGRGRGGG